MSAAFPIVITSAGGENYRLVVADGSEGLSHSNGILVSNPESVLNILSGLLGHSTLDVDSAPWGPVYTAMLARLQ